MPAEAFVYILASRRNGTLYVGVTTQLANRLSQHRAATTNSFSARHGVFRLVHLERFSSLADARYRERQLKWWRRAWKVELIEQRNPAWRDLSREIGG
jgi:putative endonuclease